MPQTLSFIALGVYIGTTIGFLAHILFRPRHLLTIAYWLVILGVAIQTLSLLLSFPGREYPYIQSNTDAYAVISWAVALLFIILARFFRLKGTGALFMTAAAALLILSLFGVSGSAFEVSSRLTAWVLIHLLLAFLAFAVFVISFVVGVVFIILESRIKHKNLGGIVRRLPPLEVLDNIHYKALGLGLIILTAAIIIGTILNKFAHGVFFIGDPKQLWVLGTWFLYVILLEMRISVGWRGHRGILLSVLGFIIVILAFFGLQHGPNL